MPDSPAVHNIDPAIDAALQQQILVARIGENPSQAASATSSFFEEVYRYCIRSIEAGAHEGEAAIAFALSENGIDVDPVYEAHHEAFTPIGRLDLGASAVSVSGQVVLTTRNPVSYTHLTLPTNREV